MKKLALLVVCFMCASCSTLAALKGDNYPQPLTTGLNFGAGISVHRSMVSKPRAYIAEQVQRMAAAGFTVARVDFMWSQTEKKPGVYTWKNYDKFAEELAKVGMRPLFILSYGNTLYGKPVAYGPGKGRMVPRTVGARLAYVRWVSTAAEHYAAFNPVWEIWNEPNLTWFWPPKPNPAEYAELALPACKAIRNKHTGASILGPAISAGEYATVDENYYDYLQAVMANTQLAACLSAASIHPYINDVPELYLDKQPRFQAVLPPGKTLGISEWGYSTFTDYKKRQLSQTQQAAYLVRMQLMGRLSATPFMVAYDWQDDGTDQLNKQHRYGIIDFSGKPKVAYTALKAMHDELAGYQYQPKLSNWQTGSYTAVFKQAGGPGIKVAAWGLHSSTIPYPLPKGKKVLQVHGMLGQPLPVPVAQSGTLAIPVGPQPVYFTY